VTESKTRHITVCAIAVEMIALFVFFWVWLYGFRDEMTVAENGVDGPALFVLFCFLLIGVIIILSAHFKILFYIFSALETLLLLYFFLPGLFVMLMYPSGLYEVILFPLAFLLLIAPLIFYYTHTIKRARSSKEVPGKPA